MALNKVSMPVASGGKNPFDLSCDHQTSMNFLLAQPIYYRKVPRGEHFNDVVTGVVRPVSMFCPTFGRLRNNLRAFFVPFRLVYPQYDAARADVLGYSYSDAAIPETVPRFSAATLSDYFFTNLAVSPAPPLYLYITEVTDLTAIADGIYDFSVGGQYYNFNARGRRRLKLLRSLGYEFIPNGTKTFFYDALALLCYAQLYLDWYANSQYLDSAQVVALRKILAYNDPTTPLELDVTQLASLIELIFSVVYDTDEYFNAAWDTPVSPTANQFTMPTVVDVTNPSAASATTIDVLNNGTPYMKQATATNTNIGTQYIHDMLQALSNYQRRHALSGAREIDRALADYGFVSDYASLRRAVYIGNRSFDVQIGDVYSTANTSSSDVSNLGDYAGRGFGNGQGSFDYVASEDGMIIIVSTLIPSCGIVQGYDRNNRHLSRYDFYDPNFELGVQVLEKGEVYVSQNDSFYGGDTTTLGNRFAYTGRYGEYKRPRSWWTSESRFKSVDAGGDAWNLFRLFDDANFSGDITNLTHSLGFTRATDWESFNRIFNYVGSDRDKFDCFYHHEVHCMSPMKPLFETYDFKETHRQIKLDINGSKLN